MTIQDSVGNILVTQSSQMIGFVEVDIREELSLRIYPFLIEIIRQEDQNNGAQFLERFLSGPQELWGVIDSKIKSLPDLWSISKIEDEYLQYLKWIVGWTSELDLITDNLPDDTLRRLIYASVPFWKIRGTEDAIKNIMTLTTGARLRIWNWFDLRFIIGSSVISEEHEGRDSWMLSLPGPPDYEENLYNIRIVDNGSLDKQLVRNLAKLTKPSGERIYINYLGFLDLFTSDNDSSQWETPEVTSSNVFSVSNGVMRIGVTSSGSEVTFSIVEWANWNQFVLGARAQFFPIGSSCSLQILFNVIDSNNYYALEVFPSSNTTYGPSLDVLKVESGVTTILHSESLSIPIYDEVWYYFRITSVDTSSGKEIRIHIDATKYIEIVDTVSPLGSGTIGIRAINGEIEIDEVELLGLPSSIDFIDINS